MGSISRTTPITGPEWRIAEGPPREIQEAMTRQMSAEIQCRSAEVAEGVLLE